MRFVRRAFTIALCTAPLAVAGCGDSTGPEGSGTATILLTHDGTGPAAAAPLAEGLRASLGDVPTDAVSGLLLSLSRIELHRVGDEAPDGPAPEGGAGEGEEADRGGWVVIELEVAEPVDLLGPAVGDGTGDPPAEGETAGGLVLASGAVPAGTYNQLRLFFEGDAELVLDQQVSTSAGPVDPGTYAVRIPSAAQSGLKIQIGSVEIADGEAETVELETLLSATIQTLIWNANGFQMNPVMRAK